MTTPVFRRTELLEAVLDLGSMGIELKDYATTGVRVVAIGPSGCGKSNTGMLIAEQLSEQGWISVLMDPEGELGELYEVTASTPASLEQRLTQRDRPIVVIPVKDAERFCDFGAKILEVVDAIRKPVFLMVDEGQVFSTSRRKGKQDVLGLASDMFNAMVERGRKRCLDLFVTAHRFSGQLSRSVFASKNLTLVGRQEDSAVWGTLAPMFRGTGLGYTEAAALNLGEFFCFSRRGVEKVQVALAKALAQAAPAATTVRPHRPGTFAQWDDAMAEIPEARLRALTPDAIAFLGSVSGLTAQQLQAGTRALQDELAGRT